MSIFILRHFFLQQKLIVVFFSLRLVVQLQNIVMKLLTYKRILKFQLITTNN